MNKIIVLIALILSLVSCTGDEGWTDLFNGKDLIGWKKIGHQDSKFFVEDGMLVMQTTFGLYSTFLVTETEYSDFELEAEFKIDKPIGSGIQIRSSVLKEDTPIQHRDGLGRESVRIFTRGRVHGYQIDIGSKIGKTGGLYEEAGRGWLATIADNEEAIFAFKEEDWNFLRIVARGTHIQTWINGVLAVDIWDDEDRSGFIGLQLHGIKKKEIEGRRTMIKSLRIKEL